MSNESIPPQPPTLPRAILQKTYFIRALFEGRELPRDNIVNAMVQPTAELCNRTLELNQDDNQTRQRLAAYLTTTEPLDPHTVESEAITLCDYFFEGVTDPDTVDLVVAVHGGQVACMDIARLLPEDQLLAIMGRYNMLEHVMQPMLINRIQHITKDTIDTLIPIYDRIYGGLVAPAWSEAMHQRLKFLELRMGDFLNIRTLIHEAKWGAAQRDTEPSPYNAPLSRRNRNELIRNSAYVLEQLQLLKEYGISPLVVPAETIGLPWDISILPPTANEEQVYEDGAIADFTFLVPSSSPNHGLLREVETSLIPGMKEVMIGDDPDSYVQRLRLHDNGQISFGRLYHNVPNDALEEIFIKYDVHAAYERIRGLLIAIAFDCTVPETVVRERVGGSVASQYQEIGQASPMSEVINELLLRRKRELGRARVGPKNRVPDDWDPPFKQPIGGYISALPAGYRRRPTAEQEAYDYYRKIGRVFTGLEPGQNFTRPYRRKSSQATEELTVRRIRFKNTANTARFLGSLGTGRP